MEQRITIKDLARIAGVNDSTVSRALADHPSISEEQKQKILEIAKRLNYRPNHLAKGLRGKKTRSIGLIIPDIQNPFYPAVTRGIEDHSQNMGYNLILCNSDYDPVKEENYINLLLDKHVDGIIIFPTMLRPQKMELLYQYKVPFILMDSSPQGFDANYIYTDHEIGAYTAVKYLIDHGHRSISLFTGKKGLLSSVEQMEAGYKRALEEAGIKFRRSLIFSSSLQEKDGLGKVSLDLVAKQKTLEFTAVLCISDIFAKSIYDAAIQVGLRIPEDLSVIGYDNTFICSCLNPGLTSMSQPGYELGYQAIELLLRQIKEGANWQYQIIRLKPTLVERASVMNRRAD